MIIAVRTFSGNVVARPDTTWKKDNDTLFLPDFVDTVSYTPVAFVRVSRAGRCVAAKFADRYYDAVCYGVLLYPENLIDGSPEGFASACCLDYSTFLAFPMYNKVTLGREGNIFELKRDSEQIFERQAIDASTLDSAVEDVTKFIHIRTGDLIAVELAPRKVLASRDNCSETLVEGTFCGNYLLDFKLHF